MSRETHRKTKQRGQRRQPPARPTGRRGRDTGQVAIESMAQNIARQCLKSCVIVDVETTGVDPNVDRIIQIAWRRILGGEVFESASFWINPANNGRYPVPDACLADPEWMRTNKTMAFGHGRELVGALSAMVWWPHSRRVGALPECKALKQSKDALRIPAVCGWNLDFDLRMIKAECARHGLKGIPEAIAAQAHCDVMQLKRMKFPNLKSYALDKVAGVEPQHRADIDVALTETELREIAGR